jgi:hypothetical protein
MAITTLLGALVPDAASASTITITPRPTGSASTGVTALKVSTAYLHAGVGSAPAEWSSQDVTYFVLASDIPGVTILDNWQITDGASTYQVTNPTKWPFTVNAADLTFWQVDARRLPGQ